MLTSLPMPLCVLTAFCLMVLQSINLAHTSLFSTVLLANQWISFRTSANPSCRTCWTTQNEWSRWHWNQMRWVGLLFIIYECKPQTFYFLYELPYTNWKFVSQMREKGSDDLRRRAMLTELRSVLEEWWEQNFAVFFSPNQTRLQLREWWFIVTISSQFIINFDCCIWR